MSKHGCVVAYNGNTGGQIPLRANARDTADGRSVLELGLEHGPLGFRSELGARRESGLALRPALRVDLPE